MRSDAPSQGARDSKLKDRPGMFEGSSGWRATIVVATLAGLFIMLLHAGAQGRGFLTTASVGLLVAGAGLILGGLIGFLFGIPRSLQSEHPQQPAKSKDGADGKDDAARKDPQGREPDRYGANTNLEQISDWLTKILVGVGLTQLTRLPEGLSSTANYVGRAASA
jgi:hypothetical protein